MADNNMPKNDTLVSGDSENFMRLMNRALARIEKVDAATNKANESLKEYANTFDELNSKLEEYVHLSGDVKANKFGRVTLKTSGGSYSGGSNGQRNKQKSVEDEVQELRNKSNKVIGESADLIFNAVNSLGGKYSKTITSTIGKVEKVVSKSKGVAKASKDVAKYSAEVTAAGKATSGLTKTVTALGTKAGIVGGVISGTVLILGLMAEAGRYAYERNQQLNRSLMQLGVSNDELTSATSSTANKIIGIKNTWTRIGDDLAGSFEPFFDLAVDFVDFIGRAVEKVTDPLDKDHDYSYADTRVRGYTKNLENISGEPENKSIPTISGIAGSAKQSGFDNSSAANLAIGTYDKAMALARKYGLEASDIAKQLADAWLTGSDAAKDYGVVVDDQVLAGYMASQGVDIVNTRITDAMKQYYRYQLMLEEASSDNSDYMQEQIKQWKKLGFQIDATKGKLFSFDEVIQLNATDPKIPTVGKPDVSYPSVGNNGGSGGGIIPPGVIPPGGNPPVLDPAPEVAVNPIRIPVIYEEAAPLKLPQPVPISVPVSVPGLQMLPELVTSLGLVYNMLPLPVSIPVSIPGFSLVGDLLDILEQFPSSVPVNIPVTVPGFELAPNLLEYCTQLAMHPWLASVLVSIPAFSLAPTLLGYLMDIAQSWVSKVNISVAGQAALEKAYSLLTAVRSLLASMGQSIVSSVRTGLSNAGNRVMNFGQGFRGNTANSNNTSNILSNWSPVSSSAYGGGFKGALLADLDLNLVRSGFKNKTKEGYTKSDIKNAQANYIGYNMNPFNKNSAANLMVKGTAASAAIAGGYGLARSATGALATGAKGALSSIQGGAAGYVNYLNGARNAKLNFTLIQGGAAGYVNSLNPALAAGFVNSLNGARNAKLALTLIQGGAAGFVNSLNPALAVGFANGGIGTREVNNATLFEGNKKEAVIPLETSAGIKYLSDALKDAGLDAPSGGDIVINLTLSGVNIADNNAEWERVGRKIAEVIDVQRQRRGELNYGSKF